MMWRQNQFLRNVSLYKSFTIWTKSN